MKAEDFTFNADGQRLAATRVQPEAGAASSILTLHGLGHTSNRHTIRYVLNHLAEHGLGSVCFEFSGNGDSSGVMEESCLQRRYGEVLAAAEHLDKREPLTLIGTSMGGHLAAWLAPILAGLPGAVLPGLLSGRCRRVPVRRRPGQPGPYADSPAYAGISAFDGDLLIIGARKDDVVPAAVLDGYLAAAERPQQAHRLAGRLRAFHPSLVAASGYAAAASAEDDTGHHPAGARANESIGGSHARRTHSD